MKKKIIFFTGAGVSAESGIPTFRGNEDSLWSKYNMDIVASSDGIKTNLKDVLNFHNDARQMISKCDPNYCHKKIAELEQDYEVTVITTNIDELHEKAGSTNVIHLHGNIFESCDIDKNKPYSCNKLLKDGDLHPITGKQLRPNTVLFGEQLEVDCYKLFRQAEKADYLIIVGSSLQVYPSASIIRYNKNIIYLNPERCGLYDKKWININKSAVEGIDEVIQLIK